ncbi:KdsC family phosphatase [Clostridium paraputrificum]|uniref:KdsC family phosphatase n=1 Tax=Clostridium paraputrificum TaxID=29363 RepID=UPI003D335E31
MDRITAELKEKTSKIKMLIMDVDGTMTDGKIYIGLSGEEFKAFNVKDGYGIKLLHENSIRTAIITGRESEIVKHRARELNIEDIFQGIHNKVEKYEIIKDKYNLRDDEIAHIGDDINDVSIFNKVGLKIAVADAIDEIKSMADIITIKRGGDGAVREIIDIILRVKESI